MNLSHFSSCKYLALWIFSMVLLNPLHLAADTEYISEADRKNEWWHYHITSMIDVTAYMNDLETIGANVVRFPGFATQGPWFADYRKNEGWRVQSERATRQAGSRVAVFPYMRGCYSLVVFVSPEGEILYSGHNLHTYQGESGRIDEMDVRNFMFDGELLHHGKRLPTASDLDVRPFRHPNGELVGFDEFYDAISLRSLGGDYLRLFYANNRITDEIAAQTGLDQVSFRREAPAHTRGLGGWVINTDYAADAANPHFVEMKVREIERIIEILRPDLIHFDHFETPSRLMVNHFGEWSVARFREFLAENMSSEQLERAGVADFGAFDVRDYLRDRPWRKTANNDGEYWQSDLWLTDPIFRAYLVFTVRVNQEYARALYKAVKKYSKKHLGREIPVSGNAIPTFPTVELLRDYMDFTDFEWKMDNSYGFYRNTDGYYPDGRIGWAAKWARSISRAGHSIVHSYVDHEHTGSDHTGLHKVMHFDALANRSTLAFGQWYRGSHTPGYPGSAGILNRFTDDVKDRLSKREFVSDIGLVVCGWSKIAAADMSGYQSESVRDRYLHEVVGWARYLSKSHYQWDIVLSQDLSDLADRYQILLLPSKLVLSTDDVEVLTTFVQNGGRLVVTGDAGRFYGPERFLLPRDSDVLEPLRRLPGVIVINDMPGRDYDAEVGETGSPDGLAERKMEALLMLSDLKPSVELKTLLPSGNTVGVLLNRDKSGKVWSLDIVNYNLNRWVNHIDYTPALVVSVRIPGLSDWKRVRIQYLTPGPEGQAIFRPLDESLIEVHSEDAKIILTVPEFEYYKVVLIEEVTD